MPAYAHAGKLPITPAIAATPVTCDPLQAAFGKFLIEMSGCRPSQLRAENSPAALAERIHNIHIVMIFMRDYLKALVEDTAPHVSCSKRLDDLITAHMDDLAGDLVGELRQAMDGNR